MGALTKDGRVFLWGENTDGYLGVTSESAIVTEPTEVPGVSELHPVQV